jgi:8-oxo-dGTP pyrophosphatase MutT (NUDIX family)
MKDEPNMLLFTQNNETFMRPADYETVIDIGAKGAIENGETPKEAALRELREETGLTLKLDGHFEARDTYEFDVLDPFTKEVREHIRKSVVYFLAFAKEEDTARVRLSPEHISYEVVRVSKALELLKYESQKDVVRKLALHLEELRKR